MVGVVLLDNRDRVLQNLAVVLPLPVIKAIHPWSHYLTGTEGSLDLVRIRLYEVDFAKAERAKCGTNLSDCGCEEPARALMRENELFSRYRSHKKCLTYSSQTEAR